MRKSRLTKTQFIKMINEHEAGMLPLPAISALAVQKKDVGPNSYDLLELAGRMRRAHFEPGRGCCIRTCQRQNSPDSASSRSSQRKRRLNLAQTTGLKATT